MADTLQSLAILGATGSIGDSTLAIIRQHPTRYRIHALTGFSRVDKLLALAMEFHPVKICTSPDNYAQLPKVTDAGLDTIILSGDEGLIEIASDEAVDTVVAAIVGAAGLSFTLAAAGAGKRILLANKESLVMAGDLVHQNCQNTVQTILPIDSEHNAIYQCLPAAIQADNTAIHHTSMVSKTVANSFWWQLWISQSNKCKMPVSKKR